MRWEASLWMRPYETGDERRFQPRADMAEDLAAAAWDWTQGPPGQTWTLIRADGTVLGLGGFVDRGQDVFEAWSVLGALRARDVFQALWLAARRIEGARIVLGARRIVAGARAADLGACRGLERLGFCNVGFGYDDRLPGVWIQHFERGA